ncbi:MAG: LptF/LptG family permease [Sulfuricurvum sp.]
MKILKNYLLNAIWVQFLSIFLPLFGIASIVFLIKLATYTAVIQLNILEMLKLFLFMLPELLFYTLSISYFVAIALAIYKLSSDSETIVFFSFGVSPSHILKVLFRPSLLLSFILLFDFAVILPHAKTLSSSFLAQKKSEAKLNLGASEFGHKFGDWLLYIGKDNKDGTYNEVLLFNKNKDEEILIESNSAEIQNDGNALRLKLNDGEGYSYSREKFSQIDFTSMYINDISEYKGDKYKTPLEYWLKDSSKTKKKMLTINTILSLFPLLSLLIALSISILHSRAQKPMIYLFMFLTIVIYNALAVGLQLTISYYAIIAHIAIWLAGSYFIYKRSVLSRF